MKKLLMTVMSFLLVISICGCSGGSSKSKEDLLAEAKELNNTDFYDDVMNNQVKAEDTYKGKPFIITGVAHDISSSSVKVGQFKVNLSRDEIVKLDDKQVVTVVGIIKDFKIVEGSGSVAGTTYTSKTVEAELQNSYLVSDTQEITGTIEMYYMDIYSSSGKATKRTGQPEAWWLAVVTGSVGSSPEYHLEDAVPVTHTKGKDITKVTISGKEVVSGSKITIKGKVFYEGTTTVGGSTAKYKMTDVELINN